MSGLYADARTVRPYTTIGNRASCIDNCASLKFSLVAVAVVGGWADDDVVLHGDVDDFAGFHDAAGEVVVLR